MCITFRAFILKLNQKIYDMTFSSARWTRGSNYVSQKFIYFETQFHLHICFNFTKIIPFIRFDETFEFFSKWSKCNVNLSDCKLVIEVENSIFNGM